MSEHIMQRLKEQTPYTNVLDGELMKEAADEIERLQGLIVQIEDYNTALCSAFAEENERLQEENDAWRMDGGSCAEEVKRLREENAQLQAQREKDKRLNHETESGLLEENVRLREETDEWEKSHNTLVKEIEHLRLLVIQLEDYNKALAAEFREENARMRKGRRDLLHVLLTNVSLSMEAFDVNAAIREEDND